MLLQYMLLLYTSLSLLSLVVLLLLLFNTVIVYDIIIHATIIIIIIIAITIVLSFIVITSINISISIITIIIIMIGINTIDCWHARLRVELRGGDDLLASGVWRLMIMFISVLDLASGVSIRRQAAGMAASGLAAGSIMFY